jgi:hypothetical protein
MIHKRTAFVATHAVSFFDLVFLQWVTIQKNSEKFQDLPRALCWVGPSAGLLGRS